MSPLFPSARLRRNGVPCLSRWHVLESGSPYNSLGMYGSGLCPCLPAVRSRCTQPERLRLWGGSWQVQHGNDAQDGTEATRSIVTGAKPGCQCCPGSFLYGSQVLPLTHWLDMGPLFRIMRVLTFQNLYVTCERSSSLASEYFLCAKHCAVLFRYMVSFHFFSTLEGGITILILGMRKLDTVRLSLDDRWTERWGRAHLLASRTLHHPLCGTRLARWSQ